MGLPKDRDARRYYRGAMRRLEDAELILGKLNRAAAAIYLGGYAVECILKALMIERTSKGDRGQLLRDLRRDDPRTGRCYGHNLLGLRTGVIQRGVDAPGPVLGEFVYVESWSEEARYDPAEGSLRDAERFITAVRRIVAWADSRI